MLQKGLGRDKIVEIHVRCVADQLLEAVERTDGSHGHHPFDKSPQSHAGQCIGVYYGYFGGWLQDVFRGKVTKTIYIKRKGDETKFSFPE